MTRIELDLDGTMGREQQVRLPQGTIKYRERGSGDPLVFVHGLLVNGALWRKVVPKLAESHRCIVPELPLGSHTTAVDADADLTPPGLARLVADFLEALELEDVTLVGNDTGGAISQLVATGHPERLARLVLTPCDAYENFPPPMFKPLLAAAKVPGGLVAALAPLRARKLRRLPLAYGGLSKRPVDDAVTDTWVEPTLDDADVRRDVIKVLKGLDPAHTLDAAARFPSFDRPVLLAWAPEDRFFGLEYAQRMAASFPDARIEEIEDSYTFVSEDQPDRLVSLIEAFVAEPGAVAAPA